MNLTPTNNNLVHEAVEFYWGKRCPDHDPDCPTCKAYALYDRMILAANRGNTHHMLSCDATKTGDDSKCNCMDWGTT